MLIDGRKVLYSVKAKKLVYPEIPTEGLVCYLDTRGKTNKDKHKGTLLDLSGNGNHGTLMNFNFTEESGYVKDLSGGTSGLQFDGVDDGIMLNIDMSQDFTIFTKLNVPPTMKGDMRFTIDCKEESFYSKSWIQIMKNYTFFQLKKKGLEEYEPHRHSRLDGLNKIAVRKNGDKITMFANETKVESVLANSLIPNKLTFINKTASGEGGELNDVKIYNRPLTDEEITHLMEG